MITISATDLDGQVHELKAEEGDNLMEVLNDYEWGTPALCGGLCSCGTCHVYLGEDWTDKFPPTDSDEQDLLNEFPTTKDNSRLSCQIYLRAAHDGLKLAIAPGE